MTVQEVDFDLILIWIFSFSFCPFDINKPMRYALSMP